MQTKNEQKFPSLDDVTKGMNRQQRRNYERRVKGLNPEQRKELDERIVAGNVSNQITKAWNKAITMAMIDGMDFTVNKYFTEFVAEIDKKGISQSQRNRMIESLLSEIRLGYANMQKRQAAAEQVKAANAAKEGSEETPESGEESK